MHKYNSIVFDCDGVILNSNKIKTEAFYDVALRFGESPANELVKFHKKNGGVSRFLKFQFFYEKILKISFDENDISALTKEYGNIVFKKLLKCELNKDLTYLKKLSNNVDWMVASGSYQVELRRVFEERKISKLFNKGIFGSPDTKESILERELELNNISLPGLFIGDSKYDYYSSKKHGFDFIFMSNWTEVADWKNFCLVNNIKYTSDLKSLLI